MIVSLAGAAGLMGVRAAAAGLISEIAPWGVATLSQTNSAEALPAYIEVEGVGGLTQPEVVIVDGRASGARRGLVLQVLDFVTVPAGSVQPNVRLLSAPDWPDDTQPFVSSSAADPGVFTRVAPVNGAPPLALLNSQGLLQTVMIFLFDRPTQLTPGATLNTTLFHGAQLLDVVTLGPTGGTTAGPYAGEPVTTLAPGEALLRPGLGVDPVPLYVSGAAVTNTYLHGLPSWKGVLAGYDPYVPTLNPALPNTDLAMHHPEPASMLLLTLALTLPLARRPHRR